MDNIYIFFVVALFLLAISDLWVGVGNDAVNFLNSAVGSKVAPMRIILFIASLGILAGATFSSGMMEVARSGVFHPNQFYFSEIMVIFLAVMITDIILLDTFNTFGLPTSTTVSIVFELLGAAVAVSLFKIYTSPESIQELGNYINSARALAIISGILLSVVIAFTVGAVVQFISRLIFTFNYERNLPYFGAIWGSIAITSIVYFMLVKGARGASFMTPEAISWINTNTYSLLLYCFIGFFILSQILISVFKVNILKVIVLIGTFSIAMAFAGNDLVNFIGVPLAGFDSFMHIYQNPSIDASTYTMESLLTPVKTPTLFLLGAGLIMIASLIFSKKARTVTQTEVDLARQGEGSERFSSSIFAQAIVRKTMSLSHSINRALPERAIQFIDRRFEPVMAKPKSMKKRAHFDMLRASVNMFIASILIALATSFKLPLSTTYVTFMVAMGTSLSDRAWGRESAVYRITGVLTVIGGWFFTAFTAFSGAFIFGLFISWGGYIATIGALILAFIFLVRTHFIHKKRSEAQSLTEEKEKRVFTSQGVVAECEDNIIQTLSTVSKLHSDLTIFFIQEDWKKLKKTAKSSRELNELTRELKKDVYVTLRKLKDDSVETGHHYVFILDYLREIATCLTFIADPFKEHLDNAHQSVIAEQEADLVKLNNNLNVFFADVLLMLRNKNYAELGVLKVNTLTILNQIDKIKKQQIKLIKAEKIGTRNSLVVINYLTETKNIVSHTMHILDSHQDFITSQGND